MNFKTIFWEDKEWTMAKVIGYPGAVVQSTSIEEAKDVLEDAMVDFIKARLDKGLKIKEEFSFDSLKTLLKQYEDDNVIIGFISVDERKADKNFYKTERTNLSVVSGYKAKAKKDNLNLSSFLNKALEKRYG